MNKAKPEIKTNFDKMDTAFNIFVKGGDNFTFIVSKSVEELNSEIRKVMIEDSFMEINPINNTNHVNGENIVVFLTSQLLKDSVLITTTLFKDKTESKDNVISMHKHVDREDDEDY